MTIPDNTLCMIVRIKTKPLCENNRRIVNTISGHDELNRRHVIALQTLLVEKGGKFVNVDPGTVCKIFELYLMPLGTSGREERNLFGVPLPNGNLLKII